MFFSSCGDIWKIFLTTFRPNLLLCPSLINDELQLIAAPLILCISRNESILQIRGHHAVGCVRWTLAKLWCLLVSIWRAEPFRRGGRSAAQGPFTGTPHTSSSSCSTPSSGTLFTWTPPSGVAGHGGTPRSGTFLEHTAGLQWVAGLLSFWHFLPHRGVEVLDILLSLEASLAASSSKLTFAAP